MTCWLWRTLPTGPLRYSGDHLPTLKSLDTEGRVLHLGSFSKILAPGMRLGWAVAEPDMLERLGLLKLAADTQSSTLNMAATSAYLARFDLDAHIAGSVPVYRHKRDLMLATMAETFPGSVSWTEPDGGLFTWLTFPRGIRRRRVHDRATTARGQSRLRPRGDVLPRSPAAAACPDELLRRP